MANSITSTVQAFIDSVIGLANTVGTVNKDATDDIILAAFNVTENPPDVDGKRSVSFSPNPTISNEALFLKNVKEVEDGSFQAERVDDAELVKSLTTIDGKEGTLKPLFCIHGFLGSPKNWINLVNDAQDKATKNGLKLIPVIWPAPGGSTRNEGLLAYDNARDEATRSSMSIAKAFQKAFVALGEEGFGMDVLGTSMGNWVLKQVAKSRMSTESIDFVFENIFMNASDVRGDIFNTEDGAAIVDMASDTGLVQVHYNTKDSVLIGSTNFFPDINPDAFLEIPFFGRVVRDVSSLYISRLGYRGILGLESLTDEKTKIVQFDCTADIKRNDIDALQQHGYVFNNFLFEKFYGKTKEDVLNVDKIQKYA